MVKFIYPTCIKRPGTEDPANCLVLENQND